MEILYLLIPLSVALVFAIGAAFWWSVRNGQLLSEPLGQSKVFPPMVVRMIAIGERTGALEVLLEKIAEFYDAQVKAAVKSLTSLIEPLLISVMGVIVGGVVMSVFLPILDVVGKLGG